MTVKTLVDTEKVNSQTTDIDLLSTEVMLQRINQQDQLVALAVEKAIPEIAKVVGVVKQAFESGGRLFYVGAGTSGRLGVLDASECVPTFSTAPELVQGIIAGGDNALKNAIEGAEDSPEMGEADLKAKKLTASDVVIGLSASGLAKYVEAALSYAKQQGAKTACVTCASNSPLIEKVDTAIVVLTGPEVITGSTRLKAGTAQKLVLNMITTGAMIAWGKTLGNLMVDVKPTNQKLKKRAIRLVSTIAEVDESQAELLLEQSNWQVKVAVLRAKNNCSTQQAEQLLTENQNKLKQSLLNQYL